MRREVFEIDGGETRASGDSGSVAVDEESVSDEGTTPEEVILIVEVETNARGVLRLGLEAGGTTVAAEAVRVGIDRLRRAGTADTRVMRRSTLAAAIHRSLA